MVERRALIPTHRTAIGCLLVGLTLLGVGASQALAEPDLSDWRIEQDRSSHPVGADGEVRIVNLRGGVNLRAGDGDLVVISTVSQRHLDDPREPQVDVEDLPNGVSVEVRFDDGANIDEKTEWRNRRIDIGVSVPKGVALSIRTGDGDIEVLDLAGRADLETTTGDITFKGPGGLQARSDSGAVFAQFRRSDWSEPVSIETSTGDIRAEFLEGAAATAKIETRGSISTDFTVSIDRSPGSLHKRGVATIGGGGQTLQLTSFSGPIRLSAVIVPEAKSE